MSATKLRVEIADIDKRKISLILVADEDWYRYRRDGHQLTPAAVLAPRRTTLPGGAASGHREFLPCALRVSGRRRIARRRLRPGRRTP